ncbi:MAG: aminodeoxychorismate/anthranilate synthase component II [Opitutae bacterium]|nr:aminodeoxychorismate/anthranilate synthase component II [Opitutae bacterium]MBT4223432.1 aminodeoxychorismate/anthranilate synthase component II [Opitutae bacterium]MBT5378299.1 aminodeoxychorismate/anthranilate synthase component II [Opitutae bacterium]MBT5691812.1 aminodeoxychorismate/anthranilate synthase component II [Opitutae bacterium]MBT6462855.1 aminodeoxychorismate/anthranilate synthase component II [Opitutae bacterium]
MMLVIDNFDSFTYNLVQYFGQLGVEQKVVRNNEVTADEALALKPKRILISPGPCSPAQAGNSLSIINAFQGKVPILGVCLGHQCIGEFFGGKIIRAERIMHGKLSPIRHDGKDLFKDLPQDFQATRYHSLVIEKDSTPECLEITATSNDKEIMGIRHKELPIWGIQFHPESIAAEYGMQILENFINLKAN